MEQSLPDDLHSAYLQTEVNLSTEWVMKMRQTALMKCLRPCMGVESIFADFHWAAIAPLAKDLLTSTVVPVKWELTHTLRSEKDKPLGTATDTDVEDRRRFNISSEENVPPPEIAGIVLDDRVLEDEWMIVGFRISTSALQSGYQTLVHIKAWCHTKQFCCR